MNLFVDPAVATLGLLLATSGGRGKPLAGRMLRCVTWAQPRYIPLRVHNNPEATARLIGIALRQVLDPVMPFVENVVIEKNYRQTEKFSVSVTAALSAMPWNPRFFIVSPSSVKARFNLLGRDRDPGKTGLKAWAKKTYPNFPAAHTNDHIADCLLLHHAFQDPKHISIFRKMPLSKAEIDQRQPGLWDNVIQKAWNKMDLLKSDTVCNFLRELGWTPSVFTKRNDATGEMENSHFIRKFKHNVKLASGAVCPIDVTPELAHIVDKSAKLLRTTTEASEYHDLCTENDRKSDNFAALGGHGWTIEPTQKKKMKATVWHENEDGERRKLTADSRVIGDRRDVTPSEYAELYEDFKEKERRALGDIATLQERVATLEKMVMEGGGGGDKRKRVTAPVPTLEEGEITAPAPKKPRAPKKKRATKLIEAPKTPELNYGLSDPLQEN